MSVNGTPTEPIYVEAPLFPLPDKSLPNATPDYFYACGHCGETVLAVAAMQVGWRDGYIHYFCDGNHAHEWVVAQKDAEA